MAKCSLISELALITKMQSLTSFEDMDWSEIKNLFLRKNIVLILPHLINIPY